MFMKSATCLNSRTRARPAKVITGRVLSAEITGDRTVAVLVLDGGYKLQRGDCIVAIAGLEMDESIEVRA
jgi:hypothetical protein